MGFWHTLPLSEKQQKEPLSGHHASMSVNIEITCDSSSKFSLSSVSFHATCLSVSEWTVHLLAFKIYVRCRLPRPSAFLPALVTSRSQEAHRLPPFFDDLQAVHFKVDEKSYIVLDMEWILSLVNGRIFCPARMAGTQPRLDYDVHGRTTVGEFRDVFRDTKEEELLLELFQKLELCIRYGPGGENLTFPSLMRTSPPEDCWIPSTNNSSIVSFGLCMKCFHPVGFSPSFFPRLQVHLYNTWLDFFQIEIPLWQGGLKVIQACEDTQRVVEAVVVLADDSFDTHIVVRSHKDDTAAALALREVLVQQVYQMAEAVSQGSQVDRQVLGRRSLGEYSIEERASMVHFSIAELREACAERRPPVASQWGATAAATTRDDAPDHLVPIESVHHMQETGRMHGFLLDRQTMAIIEETVGDDWVSFAAELGFTANEIGDVRRQSRQTGESMTTLVLRQWQRRMTADVPGLLAALQACHRCTEAVEASMARHRRFQQSIVTGNLLPVENELEEF